MKQMIFILCFLSISSMNGMEFLRALFTKEKPLPFYEFRVREETGHHEDVGEAIGSTFPAIQITADCTNCEDRRGGALYMRSDHRKLAWVVDHLSFLIHRNTKCYEAECYLLNDKDEAEVRCQLLHRAISFARKQNSKKLIYHIDPEHTKAMEMMGAECSYPAEFDNKKCTKCVFDVTQDIYKFY